MSEGAVGGGVEGTESGSGAPAGSTQPGPSVSESLGLRGDTPEAGESGGVSNVPEWAKGLETEAAAFVANKGWDDPAKVVDSYRNLEKLHGAGADALVKMPNWDNEKEVGDFHARLGVPQEASAYALEPMTLDNGAEFDMDIVKGIAHKIEATPRQASKFAEAIKEYFDTSLAAEAQAQVTRDEADRVDLRKDWGDEYEARLELGRKAAQAFGKFLDSDTLDAMQKSIGLAKTHRLLAAMGELVTERPRGDSVTGSGGGAPSFGLTPEMAAEQLKQMDATPGMLDKLKADPNLRAQRAKLQKVINGV